MNKRERNELERNLLRFMARDRRGHSTEEVAKALGIKPRTARKMLNRLARRDYLLRTQINKKPPFYMAALKTNDLFAREFGLTRRHSERKSLDVKMDMVGKDGMQ